MSVLVADFDNRTGESGSGGAGVVTGTLETAMGTALEGASFVNLYSRRTAHQLVEKIDPGRPLDVSMARLISAREGIKVVVGGTIERDPSGYALEVEAIDPANGKVLGSATAAAPSPERLLVAVNTAAARLRGALGDTTPESARMAAVETVTTSSLEALGAYVRAQELAAQGQDQEAIEQFQRAISIDPSFGRAYAGMGVIYYNLKDSANAQAAFDKALKLLDRMSDREKYRTLGTYYLGVALNYEKAVETYEALLKLYPADDVARANLGLAYLYQGDVQRAIVQIREVLKLNPRSTLDRYNLAIQSVYVGDFEGAVKEGTRGIDESPTYEQPYLAVALAKLFLGDLPGASDTYERVEQVSPSGGSLGRLGRADLLLYRGRYREALSLLQQSLELDEKAGQHGNDGAAVRRAGRGPSGSRPEAAGHLGGAPGRREERARERALPCRAGAGRGPTRRRGREDRGRHGEHAAVAHDRVCAARPGGDRNAGRPSRRGGRAVPRQPQATRHLARATDAREAVHRDEAVHRGARRARFLPEALRRVGGRLLLRLPDRALPAAPCTTTWRAPRRRSAAPTRRRTTSASSTCAATPTRATRWPPTRRSASAAGPAS